MRSNPFRSSGLAVLSLCTGASLLSQNPPRDPALEGSESYRRCRTAPAAPVGLRSPSQTSTSLVLTWNPVISPANCRVTYSVYDRTTRLAKGLTAATVTLTGLTPGTTYFLAVVAKDDAGTSPRSQVLRVQTPSGGEGCGAPPGAPTGLVSPSQTGNTVTLSWTASSAPPGCVVSYAVQQDGRTVQTVPNTTAVVTGLAAATTYTFTVAAKDSAGSSQPSAALRVTTPPSSTPTPASVLAEVQARMTAANRVNTRPHLNSMDHSIPVDVYQVASGIFAFNSGMAIDDDGVDPDSDPDHQGQTTWQTSDGQFLGARHVPYYVLGDVCYDRSSPCQWFYYPEHTITGLQFALVFYQGKAIGAVFGDTQGPPGGDARELGEASVQTASLLGIPSSGTTGGVNNGVVYVIFSGPQWVLSGTNSTLNGNAQALVSQALATLAAALGSQAR